jgi:two-component system phosphate regulon sensor histidine kinase PhoR
MTGALTLILAGASGAALVAWWRHRRRSRAMRMLAVRIGRLADEPTTAADLGAAPPRDAALVALARAALRLDERRHAQLDVVRIERDVRERVLAHMSDGVVLLDGAGRVQLMNRRAAELLGLARPATAGVPLSDASRDPALLELLARRRPGGHVLEGRLALWGSAERLLRARGHAARPRRFRGRAARAAGPHRLRPARPRAARFRRERVARAAHAAHLAPRLRRDAARRRARGSEHREGFVRVIRDQAMRLQAMTEDLLSLAELERPGAAIEPRPFDLRVAMLAVLGTFRDEAARRHLALELEPGESVVVVADRLRIEQAVANLVDNALKYTESGGVTLRAGRDGAVAFAEVTGHGTRHSRGRSGPRVRALLPRRSRALARARRHGARSLDREAHRRAPRGTVGVVSPPGRGSTFRLEIPPRGRRRLTARRRAPLRTPRRFSSAVTSASRRVHPATPTVRPR